MGEKAREELEEKLRTLNSRRAQLRAELARTRRHLRTLERRDRQKRLCRLGELIELVGLADADPRLLLGSLCEAAERCKNPETATRWTAVGEAMLSEHRENQILRPESD